MGFIHTIPVVTRLQDNGDGGYTMHIYNDEDEMIADHPLNENANDEGEELSEEIKLKILSGDDEYENGYIGNDTIEVQVECYNQDEAKVRLAKPLHFHAGQ